MARRASRRHKTGLYYPRKVPLAAIKRYARAIAQRFDPDKIILFGSYAYGKPTPDSDVDLLVVMPTRNELDQAGRISDTLWAEGESRGFPVDLLVRSPSHVERLLQEDDSFMRVIFQRGKVLHEKGDAPLAPAGRSGLSVSAKTQRLHSAGPQRRVLRVSTSHRKTFEGAT